MLPMATPTMTTTDSATRRFAVACGVLSQYVKAAAPAASGAAAVMGGAVQEPSPPAGGAEQLTIFYGGRVVVLDGCTPARAAELIRYAAASAAQGQAAPVPMPEPAPALVDMPIARKASLQRFLAKRKDRAAAVADGPPYGRVEAEAPPPPAKKGKAGDSSWLALGSLGGMHAQ